MQQKLGRKRMILRKKENREKGKKDRKKEKKKESQTKNK